MLKRIAGLVFIAGALLALSGCALVQKGLDQVTPEFSIGVYKDGLGGVTIGVKLEKNKNAAELTPAPSADAPAAEEKETPKGEEK